mgnify:CR=1 FL=1
MKGLIQRGITALFFIVVMMGGLFGGHYSFVSLFAIIAGLCLWEFYTLMLPKPARVHRFIGVLLGLIPFTLTSLIQLKLVPDTRLFLAPGALLFFPFFFLAFIYELFQKSEQPFVRIAILVLGVIYIGVPFSMVDLVAFSSGTFQAGTIFGLLLLTWSNDTMAYLVGSRFGKTHLLPRISPKKTWEGSIGGAVGTLLLAFLLGNWIPLYHWVDWPVLALIVVVFGSIGDLVESMLKRSLGVKDSGKLLPGHGGLLDRFDAFIFLMPFASAYILIARAWH